MSSVYNYSDPLAFISDRIKDRNFSQFCEQAGFKPATRLIDILKGRKKISDSAFSKIVDALQIDRSEQMYLYTLISLSSTNSDKKKFMYDLLLNDLRPSGESEYKIFRDNEVELDIYSHYIYMTILSMSQLADFEANPDYINSKLIRELDPNQISSTISRLLESGLLVEDERGRIGKPFNMVSTKTDFRSKNVDHYYSMCCDLAKEAIGSDVNKREFQSFSLPLAKKKMKLAKEIIRKCRANLDALVNEDEKDTVYQVNLMMFPMTEDAKKLN